MKVTVTTVTEDIITLDVSEDLELENFKALCELELNISAQKFVVVWGGKPLSNNKAKLKDIGIKDGDMVFLQNFPSSEPVSRSNPFQGLNIDFGAIQLPGTSTGTAVSQANTAPARGDPLDDPVSFRQRLLSNPHELSLVKERNPALADALASGNLDKFKEECKKLQQLLAEREQQRLRMLTADPLDADAQRQIAEEIRQKNVDANMETAMEYSPESFGQVVMLYIDCRVNGYPVKAFVDSGAQMTIMSQSCAERCNINRLVDRRWAGVAKGVGTQKIIGRVHLCNIQIEDKHFGSAFSILEEQPMDMLLGLDMLRRHQCVIDLKENLLLIGTTNTRTRFLPESELPEHARLNKNDNPEEDEQLARAMNNSAQDASGSSLTNATSPKASQFPEETVAKLTVHGFSRQAALEELTRNKGDVDQALAALFAKSFTPP